jgi:hypothetical protein
VRTKTDALIDTYLKDLQRALGGFPGDRRREILDEVGDHIAQARAELDSESEVAIRTLLDKLGTPSDIAEAARERFDMRPVRAGVLEEVAVVALVVPFIGWLIGTILVWLSRVWTRRDKIIATVAVPGVWILFWLGTMATHSSVSVSSSAPPRNPPSPPLQPSVDEGLLDFMLSWMFPMGIILIPIGTAIYLVVRARNLSDAGTMVAVRSA